MDSKYWRFKCPCKNEQPTNKSNTFSTVELLSFRLGNEKGDLVFCQSCRQFHKGVFSK